MSFNQKHPIKQRTSSIISWKNRLSDLSLNNVHAKRTCEVFFMAERTKVYSKAVEKFLYGSQLDSLNVVKAITFEDVLLSVKHFSSATSPSVAKSYDVAFRNAAKEAVHLLETEEVIPSQLMAILIKLQIILMINQDVVMTQKELAKEKHLANERDALIQIGEDPNKGKGKKDNKGKGAAKAKDKGKGAAKAKDKGKGAAKAKDKGKRKGVVQEKAYDVCDSNNNIKPKPSSKLNRDNKEDLSYESVEVPEKHLFVIVLGFYEFDLMEELYKVGIELTGILEIAEYSDTSSNSSIEPQTENAFKVNNDIKSEVLHNFWTDFDERFESDSFPECFENTFHMTITPSELALSEESLRDQQYVDVFAEIGNEILKTVDITRQHINYIRHLKVYSVGAKPDLKSSSDFQLYRNIMDMIPPDCNNVPFILYALIEQVTSLVPDPTSSSNTEPGIFLRGIPEVHSARIHKGVKSFLTDVLNKNINVHALFGVQPSPEYEYKYNPKIDYNISRTPFLIHENNDLEIVVHPYEKISVEFLKVCNKILKLCRPVLLWKGFASTEEAKVLSNKLDLKNTCDMLELPMHELQSVIHTIFFNCLACKGYQEKAVRVNRSSLSCCSLEALFPPCQDTTPNVETLDVSSGTMSLETPAESVPDISIPNVTYIDNPSIYEARNMWTYKWYENLSEIVMLQELNKAEQTYLCLDYQYCAFDDTILLRYHNNVNRFGINRTVWNQSLRTPIGLKEFCKYIIHDESSWLAKEERRYLEEYEREFEKLKLKDELVKTTFYPDLVFGDLDFIQPGSIKARKLLEHREQKSGSKEVVGKGKGKGNDKKEKGGKGNDKKEKGGKGNDKKEKGGKGKNEANSQITLLEKLSHPTVPPVRRKLTLRPAVEEPYHFFAYDLSANRVQLTGSTVVFHSQDGVKVTVDQTRFFRAPDNLSLDINMNGHSLILHHNRANLREPFSFHFSLADQTVVVFGRPLKAHGPEEKVCEKICQTLKQQKKFPEKAKKTQQMYFISEKQNHILKCFKVPYISKRHLILSEELLLPFLQQLQKRKIPTRLLPSKETLNINEISKFEETLKSDSKIMAKSGSAMGNLKEGIKSEKATIYETFSPKYICRNISKASPVDTSGNTSSSQSFESKPKRSLTSKPIDFGSIREKSNRILVHRIKQAMESQLPIFKICSSRLHKNHYVRRVKSHVEVQIGHIMKRLPFKAPYYRSKRNMKITKLLPLKPFEFRRGCKYDFRICLPSGLLIQNVPGIDDDPFYVRQKYLDVGPQCKNIAHESYRTFMRNGVVLIKKCDGNVDILNINRQMTYCDVPYFKVKPTKTNGKERKAPGNLTALHGHSTSLTKFQKYLHRLLHRLQKHLINGPERYYRLSHKECQRWKKGHVINEDQVYILQDTASSFTKFSLITSDGNRLKVTKKAIVQEKKYYTSTIVDYRYEESYYGREDGTHSILTREGTLTTQFPDGTRITSWIDVAPEYLVVIEEEDTKSFDDPCTKQQQTDPILPSEETTYVVTSSSSCSNSTESFGAFSSHRYDSCGSVIISEDEEEEEEEEKEEEKEIEEEEEEEVCEESEPNKRANRDDGSWVSIFINFKYEHPKYATIIYYGMTKKIEVILPNDIKLKGSHKGDYTMDIGETIHAKIGAETVRLKSQFCTACMQECTSVLNVKPLYDRIQPIPSRTALLRTTDSFDKVFIVSYDGVCYKNVKCRFSRTNVSGCQNHDLEEHQKLFLLTRKLNGCKFWDVNGYKNKITKAKEDPRTVLKFSKRNKSDNVESASIKTSVDKPCDERFIIPYLEPTLILKKNKTVTGKNAETYYVTKKVFNSLPGLATLFPIYSVLVDLCNTRGIKDVFGIEFRLFLNQIVVENLKREEIILEEKFAKLEAERTMVEVKNPPIPLREKLRAWKYECNKYRILARTEIIPRYFNSDYDTFYKKPEVEEEEDYCICIDKNASGVCTSSNSSDDVKAVSNEQSILPESSTHSSSLINEDYEDSLDECIVSETTTEKKSVEDLNQEYREDLKLKEEPYQQMWYETPLGKALLDEITNRKTNMTKFAKRDEAQTASLARIVFLVKRVFRNTMLAVHSYEEQIPIEEYIAAASNAVLDDVLEEEHLNSLELTVLLRFLRNTSPNILNPLCSLKPDSVSEYCQELFKDVNLQLGPMYPSDSAFDVYKSYANVSNFTKLVKEPRIESPIFETSLSQSKATDSSILDLKGDHTEIAEGTEYETHNKCTKCSIKTKPNQITHNAKVPSQQSVEENLLKTKCLSSFTSSSSIHGETSLEKMDPDIGPGESSTSKSVPANILLSPESSLLRYCLSEISVSTDNLARVEGNAVAVVREDLNRPESMMVTFSIASLKQKDTEKKVAGPFIQRNPKEVVEKIMKATKPSPSMKKGKRTESNNKPKTETIKRLVSEESLYNCKTCILRVDQKLGVPESTSLHSITDVLKQIKSTSSLSQKDEMEPSLLNIYEECLQEVKRQKNTKSKFDAVVCDKDAALLKSGKAVGLPSDVQAILAAHPVRPRNVIRTTVGTLTVPGTMDSADQTEF